MRFLAAEEFLYWIEPCKDSQSGCEEKDAELARWAFEAWAKASNGTIRLTPASQERARIRLYWASGRQGLYGEARGIEVDGKQGAAVYIRPNLSSLGPAIAEAGASDGLFRHSIVYLTCVHELGHAFGLPHTKDFADIMYSFAYGNDILEYFSRYRRKLKDRGDIPNHPGMSAEDVRRIRLLYPSQPLL